MVSLRFDSLSMCSPWGRKIMSVVWQSSGCGIAILGRQSRYTNDDMITSSNFTSLSIPSPSLCFLHLSHSSPTLHHPPPHINTTQHNTTQHNTMLHNATQHNTTHKTQWLDRIHFFNISTRENTFIKMVWQLPTLFPSSHCTWCDISSSGPPRETVRICRIQGQEDRLQAVCKSLLCRGHWGGGDGGERRGRGTEGGRKRAHHAWEDTSLCWNIRSVS